MTTPTTTKIHPFEDSGLGLALKPDDVLLEIRQADGCVAIRLEDAG